MLNSPDNPTQWRRDAIANRITRQEKSIDASPIRLKDPDERNVPDAWTHSMCHMGDLSQPKRPQSRPLATRVSLKDPPTLILHVPRGTSSPCRRVRRLPGAVGADAGLSPKSIEGYDCRNGVASKCL